MHRRSDKSSIRRNGAVNNARQMIDALKKSNPAAELQVISPEQQAAWTPYYTEPAFTA